MANPGPVVFISWIGYHGRSEGLARRLDAVEWTHNGGQGSAFRRYVRLWKATSRFLKAEKPSAVIVMQPPVVALLAVRWHTRKLRTPIAGDLHTGVFDDPKWTWATKLTLRLLRGKNIAIVTNNALKDAAARERCRAVVLHDLIEPYTASDNVVFDDPALSILAEEKYVLIPVAYSYDEPIDELKAAAQLTPGAKWVFTGNAPEKVKSGAPSNLHFTGFVSRHDYMMLLSRATAVIAATTSENTMQRAGYEALCSARPLVTSGTTVLRDYFGDAALHAEITAQSFATAVSSVLRDAEKHIANMTRLRALKIAQQEQALHELETWLDDCQR